MRQDRFNIGGDIGFVNDAFGARRQAQGRMHRWPVFSEVDVGAVKQRFAQLLKIAVLGEFSEQRERLIGQMVFGKIKEKAGCGHGVLIKALRVGFK